MTVAGGGDAGQRVVHPATGSARVLSDVPEALPTVCERSGHGFHCAKPNKIEWAKVDAIDEITGH